jgi:hypothetical protein
MTPRGPYRLRVPDYVSDLPRAAAEGYSAWRYARQHELPVVSVTRWWKRLELPVYALVPRQRSPRAQERFQAEVT